MLDLSVESKTQNTQMKNQSRWWSGIFNATTREHDAVFSRYCGNSSDLCIYRFEVSEDLRSVRVNNRGSCANGVWTLAEIRASGAGWRTVAAVAARMRAAVRRFGSR